MVNFTILAGGFTSFIATYVFDTDSGALSLTKQNPTGDSVSWIASHSQDPSILYAVNEIGPVGNLQSFLVDSQGGLTLVDTVATGGNGPTFTNPLTTGEVSAMNFGSPNAAFIATDPLDPTRFIQDNLASTVVEFPVNGGPSNPHQSVEHNGEIFVPDLGADKIWRVAKDGETFRVQGQIDVEPGNGPRHIAIRDNLLFTLNEKTSTLTVQPIPEAPNGTTLPLIANVSIVPTLEPGFNGSFFAAEIVISEPTEAFPDPLIYVSNRNLGPDIDERGDTIAIFEFKFPSNGSDETAPSPSSSGSPTSSVLTGPVVATLRPAPVAKRMIKHHARQRTAHEQIRRQYGYGGYDYGTNAPSSDSSPSPAGVTMAGTTITLVAALPSATPVAETTAEVPAEGSLTLVNQIFTGLQQIRSFAIGKAADGGDEFLIAGANTEGGVAVFRRTEGGRNLELVARNTELQSRTSFVFL
ncbi:hypothetical protein CC1G_07821 [Coprinopsis cinerea okayama7|uniref:Isomerase YbhE n=1 Tax=Coprinopsis cinerea (strain Okayama-7 / 130 / ATCC MYA-4618 / FGSC 9003) TaxID=240176 RepID=A8P3X8_COPC7|nr:hypothetical protein CC1G_07821 [Coprinopsis cinerea okayama7\|eukprot:XP_001838630.2 hypothetical protein CC1G_07821 [Coprinopsis cinerea okayama7\